MTDRAPPAVSIGLLVYNGERHLASAMECILGQTLGDFELIIADNASTDATPQIVESYAQRDRRIRVVRQQQNIGIARNFNFSVRAARGQYFMFASANDEYEASMVAESLAMLRADSTAVLCFGGTQFIDENGARLRIYQENLVADAHDPLVRYAAVRSQLGLSTPLQCGLIRLDALRACGRMGNYRGSDVPLIAALALHGRFLQLKKIFLLRRLGKQATSTERSDLENERLFRPTASRPGGFPRWHSHLDYARTMLTAPLPLATKMRGMARVLRHAAWDRWKLLGEIGAAFRRRMPS